MRAKIIAVWGLLGKTTFAVNLAYMLAATKDSKIVTLLSSNFSYGDIQHFFGTTIGENFGLLPALASDDHARSFLSKAGDLAPLCDIFLMALANDSDALLVESPSEGDSERLIKDLADVQCDYLVVDCSSHITNPLSSVALVRADIILCLHSPGGASYQWFRSLRSFREQLDLDEKSLHILYAPDGYVSSAQYFKQIGMEIAAELPRLRNAKQYENKGVLIAATAGFETRGYINGLRRICRMI